MSFTRMNVVNFITKCQNRLHYFHQVLDRHTAKIPMCIEFAMFD